VLHVDCPWKHDDPLGKKGAAHRYPCMTVEELELIELPPMHDDCLMFFWRVSSMQKEAFAVLDAWGFEVKTELVWDKITKNGKDHFGQGRILRASHETCLIAVRGRPAVRNHSIRTKFKAVVRKHSEKPDEIFAIARRLCRGPYTELFGRAPRPGWQVLGNDPALLWDATKPQAKALEPRPQGLRLVG
jgi:N6-adenosine-specific RNA methylase IME4